MALRATEGPNAAPALSIYRPQLRPAAAAAMLNRALLRRRLGRSCPAPFEGVDELSAMIGIGATGVACRRSAHRDRLIVGFAAGGTLRGVAKLGPVDDPDLRREADALTAFAAVAGPFTVPRLRWAGRWREHFVVAMDAVEHSGGRELSRPENVVDLCVALARGIHGSEPVVHGDFCPWNLLPTARGPVLIDWEAMRFGSDPLYDLAHFVTQQAIARRRVAPRSAVSMLVAENSPGWRYLEALGIDPGRAPYLVASYLQRTAGFTGRRGFRYRVAMGRELEPYFSRLESAPRER